jgi:hypothetical protein
METSHEFIAALENADAEFHSLKELWAALLPETEVRQPKDYELRCWLKIHDIQTIREGIAAAARKCRNTGFDAKDRGAAIRFAGSVMDSRTYKP